MYGNVQTLLYLTGGYFRLESVHGEENEKLSLIGTSLSRRLALFSSYRKIQSTTPVLQQTKVPT